MKLNVTLRTALVAVLTMLSASMYADEPIKYIDSDGFEKFVNDYTVLTGKETVLTSGWYVVNEPSLVNDNGIEIDGDVRIILCDKSIWSILSNNDMKSPFGIPLGSCLRFYAQSAGEDAGRLLEDVESLHAYTSSPYFFNGDSVEINGGIIEFSGWGKNDPACLLVTFILNGGRFSISKVERGISCHNMQLNGGQLDVTASSRAITVGQELSFGKSYCDLECNCSNFFYFGDDDIYVSDFVHVTIGDKEYTGFVPYDITDEMQVTKVSSHYDAEAALSIDGIGRSVVESNAWYTLAGEQLMSKPIEKGVYIHNGEKICVR